MCKGNCGKCKKAEFETTDVQVESLGQRSGMIVDDGWISAGSKLPPEEESVIVYPYNYEDSEDFSITGCHLEGAWYCERGNLIRVTHWRPLLTPPIK
tara:strand:- start:2702 stop:2992 length:291 start_codon:yes stop_codon:yes gene_type:complete